MRGCLIINPEDGKPEIAITGGAGYIGSSIAEGLASSFNIRLLDIKQPNNSLSKNMRFHKCDITKLEEIEEHIKGADLVIHTAIIQIPQINDAKRLAYEVDIVGTQNVCKIVEKDSSIKGMILAGSWHTVGEIGLSGVIDEEFGFRPDKVEHRARLYALAKIGQESIVRFYDEISKKVYGIIRMGTVLGNGMPEKTAANIFITQGLEGNPLTPFNNSMFRPMLYVDILDVCRAYKSFAHQILNGTIMKRENSLTDIFNVYYPEAINIYDLAHFVKSAIEENTSGKVSPIINIIDTHQPALFRKEDKLKVVVDISKALHGLNLEKLKSPRESIETIVKERMVTLSAQH